MSTIYYPKWKILQPNMNKILHCYAVTARHDTPMLDCFDYPARSRRRWFHRAAFDAPSYRQLVKRVWRLLNITGFMLEGFVFSASSLVSCVVCRMRWTYVVVVRSCGVCTLCTTSCFVVQCVPDFAFSSVVGDGRLRPINGHFVSHTPTEFLYSRNNLLCGQLWQCDRTVYGRRFLWGYVVSCFVSSVLSK